LKQFSEVTKIYGSPRGRRDLGDLVEAEGQVEVFQVTPVDGDYDDGGAYWGDLKNRPLFCARDAGGAYLHFARAKNRKDALSAFGIIETGLTPGYISDVVLAYATCALWSSVGPDQEPLDDTFQVGDIPPRVLGEMRYACESFLKLVWPVGEGWTASQVGHDFWLTRNGHGAGFWDRGLPDGERLGRASKLFREVGLYADNHHNLYSI